MTRPRDYEQQQGRPLDPSDRAADLSPDDPEAQEAMPRGGPEEENDLRVVDADEIGAGTGLDEAELARVDPLDGKPWDGDRSEALSSPSLADEDFPAEAQDFDLDEEQE